MLIYHDFEEPWSALAGVVVCFAWLDMGYSTKYLMFGRWFSMGLYISMLLNVSRTLNIEYHLKYFYLDFQEGDSLPRSLLPYPARLHLLADSDAGI